jgi:Zn-dependent protease with chaperone function
MASVLLMGILAFFFSYVLGRRKKVIDQLESDVRIFLILILITSFYFRFSFVSVVYLLAVLKEFELQYMMTFLYFLFPILLGVFLYILTPSLCERNLYLTDIPAPDTVTKISNLLRLSYVPRVRTTSLEIPPFVYGRRRRSSILVLPEHMNSFLTEKEQEAVIAHELSHVKQGDTGIITWLTFLLEGFKYWILPIPLFIYFGMTSLFFVSNELISVILVLLFYVSVFFLKNSLSRIRESISDAYAVLHGYEDALKRALYKYAALTTRQKGCTFTLCFHHTAHRLLATHPPLSERLKAIERKRFIVESTKNLPIQLAFWLGLVSAFLFYNGVYSIASLEVMREIFSSVPPSETTLNFAWAVPSIAVMGAVGISYLFPSTKGLVSFSDFEDPTFLLPLVRNWGITILTAAIIVYGLTFDMRAVTILVPSICVGFFVWLTGFSSTMYSDISEKMWSLPLFPFFPVIILWYPVKIIYSLFWDAEIDLGHFVPLMGLTIVIALVFLLLLLETGHLDVGREQIIRFFGRRIEVHHSIQYWIVGNILLYCVPTLLSFALYSFFCYVDTLELLPEMTLFFIVLMGLLPFILKKSDIFFFTDVSYLVGILQNNICDEDIAFLQKVIQTYQNPDGGFDCAGMAFSNQKDTYVMVKTAHSIGMQLENAVIKRWIASTENDQGFALYPRGVSRIEGLYYAVNSLSMLGYLDEISPIHVHWVRKFFNGEYFIFENDTLSPLLQTCLAVEVLCFFNDLQGMRNCEDWIKNHFSEKLKPQEAFLATRALIALGSETELAEQWLRKNDSVLSTRLDKNTEAVYYYMKVLQELAKEIPPRALEEALDEFNRIREKHKKKFGLE